MGTEETRRKWDRRYGEKPRDSFLPEPHPMAAAVGHRFIGGPMLDAACGLGRGIATGAGAFTPVFAVDLSQVALRRARGFWAGEQRIRWIVADVTALAWPPDFFGLVCAFGFTDLPFFGRVARSVLPGGMFLYEGFSERQMEIKPGLDPAWTSTPQKMASLFSGWEIPVCEEDTEAPFRVRLAAVRSRKPDGR